jgi:hypothetical protein
MHIAPELCLLIVVRLEANLSSKVRSLNELLGDIVESLNIQPIGSVIG